MTDRDQAQGPEPADRDDASSAAAGVRHDGPVPAAVGDERPVVLATHGLSKRFGKILAVDHLDLSVRRGDVFGFLGPNGAGKTTTIRMIFGLIFPTSGYVEVLDHRVPGAARRRPAPPGRLRRGAGLLPDHERAPQPAPAGLGRRAPHRGAHRRGARHGRPAEPRRQQGGRLLARHEAASRHRQRAARPARGDHPRRAHERPRPAGHEGRARARPRARRGRHDRAALLAPAARGRAGLQPRRHHQQGAHGDRGPGRRPCGRANEAVKIVTDDQQKAGGDRQRAVRRRAP